MGPSCLLFCVPVAQMNIIPFHNYCRTPSVSVFADTNEPAVGTAHLSVTMLVTQQLSMPDQARFAMGIPALLHPDQAQCMPNHMTVSVAVNQASLFRVGHSSPSNANVLIVTC